MATLVRDAEIRSEKRVLTDFLSKYLSPEADERRYEWLYRCNPDGEARAWIATTSEGEAVIGVAAAFPRKLYCCGEQLQGFVLGDFCMHPKYRSLGPALALQKACLKSVAETGAKFGFDFPSDAMLGVYTRLKIEAQNAMIRFAKPLRTARQIEERLGSGIVSRGLTVAADLGLRMRDAMRKHAGDLTFTIETGPWNEELTLATKRWSSRMGLCVARTSDYLNWRYTRHPLRHYEMLSAWQAGNRCGYLIFNQANQNGFVVDLFAETDNIQRELIIELINIAYNRNLSTLSSPWHSSHAGKRILQDCGFKPRELRPVLLLALPGATSQQTASAMNDWYVTDGDRES